jgi:geranylgeranyl diphosphate synthase type I
VSATRGFGVQRDAGGDDPWAVPGPGDAGRGCAAHRGRPQAKTAASTTSGPLALGAIVAGAGQELCEAYAAYAGPLGLAFQLRDDLLGAFGDPDLTGKPSGDDLRDGKCTVLLAQARRLGGPDIEQRVDDWLRERSSAAVAALRAVIEDTGACSYVEQLINDLGGRAIAALESARGRAVAPGTARHRRGSDRHGQGGVGACSGPRGRASR